MAKIKILSRQRCDCCKKWVNIDDLALLKYDDAGEHAVCEKCSQKWEKLIPYETFTRLDMQGDTPTVNLIISGTKYLLSVVKDGGSWYNDDKVEERKIIQQCEKFLSAFSTLKK